MHRKHLTMKPVIIVEVEADYAEAIQSPQLLMNDMVYVTMAPLYLLYMDVYRAEHGNVDQVMSMAELQNKIDETPVGGMVLLTEANVDTYTGRGHICCKVLKMK